MRIPILVLLCSLFISPLMGQEPAFTEDLCERDADACRALAIEILRLDLVNEMESRVTAASRGSFICPDGGSCCPAGSEDFCARIEAGLLAEAQYLVAVARQDDCNLVASLCDTIETTCERDEVYLPWFGCTPPIVIEDPGLPMPPVCPPGTVPDGDVCKPQPCYASGLGIRIPCPAFEEFLVERTANAAYAGRAERSGNRLLQFIEDEAVRGAAIRGLRNDLQNAINALDRLAE